MSSSPTLRDDAASIARLAAPAVAQSLLQTMVFLVDRVMLGHHSAEALASMQCAGPTIWTISSVFSAFSIGTIAVVGRSVGARDAASATAALRASLYLAVGLGALVGALGLLVLPWLVHAMAGGAGAVVEASARGYLSVLLPALPVLFVGVVSTSALQAAGDTRTPLAIAIVTNLVNLAGNWLLIFGNAGAPRLGATGAAISNAAALTFEALLGLYALDRAASPVSLRARGLAIDVREGARKVLAVSWGAFGERMVYHTGYLAFVRITNSLGAAAMAAHQAMISIESVSFLSADGFAVAASSRVAQSLGARNVAAARRAAWVTTAMSAGLLAVVAAAFFFVPEVLLRAFRDDEGFIAIGAPALRMAAVAQVPMAISIVLAQSLRGAGATRTSMAIALVGSLGVRITMTFFFVRTLHLGLTGVWMGSATDWIARMFLCAILWRSERWARGAAREV